MERNRESEYGKNKKHSIESHQKYNGKTQFINRKTKDFSENPPNIKRSTLEGLYNKYRIYATELYRNIIHLNIPRTIDEVKKEYNVPLSTTNTKDCFIVNGKSIMLTDTYMRNIVFYFLNEQLKNTKFNTILEVGCGSGNNLKILKKNFPDKTFYGLDLSQQMIKEAQVNVPSTEFFCCSAENIPLKNSSVDVIYTVHALEQMTPILPSVIKEFKRVCYGRIFLIEPFPEFQNWIGNLHGKRLGYPKNIYSEVLTNGFTVVTFESLDFGSPANKSGLLVGLSNKTV